MILVSNYSSLLAYAAFLISFGGPGIFFATVPLSNLFKQSQFIIVVASGFYSLASFILFYLMSRVVFLVFEKIHAYGVSFRAIFVVYTIICFFLWIYNSINVYPFRVLFLV